MNEHPQWTNILNERTSSTNEHPQRTFPTNILNEPQEPTRIHHRNQPEYTTGTNQDTPQEPTVNIWEVLPILISRESSLSRSLTTKGILISRESSLSRSLTIYRILISRESSLSRFLHKRKTLYLPHICPRWFIGYPWGVFWLVPGVYWICFITNIISSSMKILNERTFSRNHPVLTSGTNQGTIQY